MQGARQADTSRIKQNILVYAEKDAETRGWTISSGLNKENRGLKSEGTAQFILPLGDRDEYTKDPRK